MTVHGAACFRILSPAQSAERQKYEREHMRECGCTDPRHAALLSNLRHCINLINDYETACEWCRGHERGSR